MTRRFQRLNRSECIDLMSAIWAGQDLFQRGRFCVSQSTPPRWQRLAKEIRLELERQNRGAKRQK